MTYLEGWGLVFKKFHYYHRYSDFGHDNFIYEIIADQRYTKMYNKPIIRFHVDPRGTIYSLLYQNGNKTEIGEMNKLNLQTNFFDSKAVCVNFDLVPDYWDNKFCPHVLKESFLLTKCNPTTDDSLYF